MEFKSLTTKEVARLCRVSDATVKRWEDAGLIKSERTGGRHRRFRAEEIARFRRELGREQKTDRSGDSVARLNARRRTDGFQSDSAFFHALIAGDEEEAAELLVGAQLQGKSASEVCDELICPAMRQIGELWYKGELSIPQEHIATRVAAFAVYKLRSVLPIAEPHGKLAVCCALEDDLHELPTLLSQTVLENLGWEVFNYGANTPLYSLAEEAERQTPELICIAATVMKDFERLARDYKALLEQTEKLKIPVILGGKVFADEQMRRRFPAALYARSFDDIARFSEQITGR